MTKFILEINLGNDGMKNDDDIAASLKEIAERIYYDGVFYKSSKQIHDINGNVVGHYEVV